CHQKAVLDFSSESAMLDKLGLEYDIPDTGCCGMAGAFGFEKGEHYRVSVACGERALLPAVRAAAADTHIVANGFSCREQIAQTTNRRAIHAAWRHGSRHRRIRSAATANDASTTITSMPSDTSTVHQVTATRLGIIIQ